MRSWCLLLKILRSVDCDVSTMSFSWSSSTSTWLARMPVGCSRTKGLLYIMKYKWVNGDCFCLLLRVSSDCSANNRAGYFSNLACDWLSIVWAYCKQGIENRPWLPYGLYSLISLQQSQFPQKYSQKIAHPLFKGIFLKKKYLLSFIFYSHFIEVDPMVTIHNKSALVQVMVWFVE